MFVVKRQFGVDIGGFVPVEYLPVFLFVVGKPLGGGINFQVPEFPAFELRAFFWRWLIRNTSFGRTASTTQGHGGLFCLSLSRLIHTYEVIARRHDRINLSSGCCD
jgi:hypothetical protein